MADTKVSALTNLAAPTRDDLLYVVNDPSGVPASRKATLESVITGPSLFVAASDATANGIKNADYVCDGVDDQVQIQAAIDALPAAGGVVQLSGGTFIVDYAGTFTGDGLVTRYSVVIQTATAPLWLKGVPGATTIKGRDGAEIGHMVLNRGTLAARRTNPTYFSGIDFFSNSVSGVALGAMYAYDITVDYCKFRGSNYYDVHFLAITQGSTFTHNKFVGQRGMRLENDHHLVSNNRFDADGGVLEGDRALLVLSPDWDQIYGDTRYTHHSSSVIGNTFMGGTIQLQAAGTKACSIAGNTFADSAVLYTAEAVLLIQCVPVCDGGGFDSIGNVVIGNTFNNVGYCIHLKGDGKGVKNSIVALNTLTHGLDRNLAWGIVEGGGTNADNQILDNNIPNLGGGTVVATGTRTVIRGNINYVTENHGAAAAVADGGTIAHGCAATPTSAQVTGSVANEFVSVTAIGAANLTVAIKKHDGTPGTNQTIYWRAWV